MVAAAVVVALLFATGVVGGGGGPEKAVRDLIAAGQSQDCSRMYGLLTDSSTSGMDPDAYCAMVDEFAGAMQGPMAENTELVSTEVTEESDSEATVATTMRNGEREDTFDFRVVREDDMWKVDLTSAFGGSAPPTEPGGGAEAPTVDPDDLPSLDPNDLPSLDPNDLPSLDPNDLPSLDPNHPSDFDDLENEMDQLQEELDNMQPPAFPN